MREGEGVRLDASRCKRMFPSLLGKHLLLGSFLSRKCGSWGSDTREGPCRIEFGEYVRLEESEGRNDDSRALQSCWLKISEFPAWDLKLDLNIESKERPRGRLVGGGFDKLSQRLTSGSCKSGSQHPPSGRISKARLRLPTGSRVSAVATSP